VVFYNRCTWSNFDHNKPLLIWGNKYSKFLENKKVIRVEDGFIRSNGLGSALTKPVSIIVDDIGIYFDSSRPSRIENICNYKRFCENDIKRARKLKRDFIRLRITKYNLQEYQWSPPIVNSNIILVVGQVETDDSIKFGSPIIKTNLDLLEQVRLENKKSYIVYKHHPEVVLKLRKSTSDVDRISELADEVVEKVSVHSLLDCVDEVHTITSLMGFEALIRNVKVVCYGIPFYAGWGLTVDKTKCNRRKNTLTIDELVYAALVEYPIYVDYEKGILASPEDAITSVMTNSNISHKKESFLKILFIFSTTIINKIKGR